MILKERNVCFIESVLEQTLQWSSVAILNFLSSFLVIIILPKLVVFCNLIFLGKIVSPVKKTVREIFCPIFYSGEFQHRALIKMFTAHFIQE